MCVYQGGSIYHCTHVPGPVAQSSAEIYYNSECTARISPSHFRMLNNEFLNKDPNVVTEQPPIIILDIKSSVCMENIGKETKHTRHTSRRMHFVRNS